MRIFKTLKELIMPKKEIVQFGDFVQIPSPKYNEVNVNTNIFSKYLAANWEDFPPLHDTKTLGLYHKITASSFKQLNDNYSSSDYHDSLNKPSTHCLPPINDHSIDHQNDAIPEADQLQTKATESGLDTKEINNVFISASIKDDKDFIKPLDSCSFESNAVANLRREQDHKAIVFGSTQPTTPIANQLNNLMDTSSVSESSVNDDIMVDEEHERPDQGNNESEINYDAVGIIDKQTSSWHDHASLDIKKGCPTYAKPITTKFMSPLINKATKVFKVKTTGFKKKLNEKINNLCLPKNDSKFKGVLSKFWKYSQTLLQKLKGSNAKKTSLMDDPVFSVPLEKMLFAEFQLDVIKKVSELNSKYETREKFLRRHQALLHYENMYKYQLLSFLRNLEPMAQALFVEYIQGNPRAQLWPITQRGVKFYEAYDIRCGRRQADAVESSMVASTPSLQAQICINAQSENENENLQPHQIRNMNYPAAVTEDILMNEICLSTEECPTTNTYKSPTFKICIPKLKTPQTNDDDSNYGLEKYMKLVSHIKRSGAQRPVVIDDATHGPPRVQDSIYHDKFDPEPMLKSSIDYYVRKKRPSKSIRIRTQSIERSIRNHLGHIPFALGANEITARWRGVLDHQCTIQWVTLFITRFKYFINKKDGLQQLTEYVDRRLVDTVYKLEYIRVDGVESDELASTTDKYGNKTEGDVDHQDEKEKDSDNIITAENEEFAAFMDGNEHIQMEGTAFKVNEEISDDAANVIKQEFISEEKEDHANCDFLSESSSRNSSHNIYESDNKMITVSLRRKNPQEHLANDCPRPSIMLIFF